MTSLSDLPPTVDTASVALSVLLLASKVLLQSFSSSLFRLNMLVKSLKADWQLTCNPIRSPLKLNQSAGLICLQRPYIRLITAFSHNAGSKVGMLDFFAVHGQFRLADHETQNAKDYQLSSYKLGKLHFEHGSAS